MVSVSHTPLDVVQRWMLDVISHPGGVEAGVNSAAARQQLDITASQLADVILPSSKCTSLQRMAVYGNAYHARLIECLAAEFPTVRYLAGEEAFANFVIEYLREFPSRSYTLAHLGRDFPKHLQQSRPTRTDEESVPDWADMLVDVARVERCVSEVFDGPGEEEEPRFDVQSLQGLSSPDAGSLRVRLTNSLRLVETCCPVHTVMRTVREWQREERTSEQGSPKSREIAFPLPQPTQLVLHRRDYVVRQQSVPAAPFVLLRELQAGRTLQEAFLAASDRWESSPGEFVAAVRGWFADWSSAGIIREVLAS